MKFSLKATMATAVFAISSTALSAQEQAQDLPELTAEEKSDINLLYSFYTCAANEPAANKLSAEYCRKSLQVTDTQLIEMQHDLLEKYGEDVFPMSRAYRQTPEFTITPIPTMPDGWTPSAK